MGNGEVNNGEGNSGKSNYGILKIYPTTRAFACINIQGSYAAKVKNKNVNSSKIQDAVNKTEAKCYRDAKGDRRCYHTLVIEACGREHVEGLF